MAFITTSMAVLEEKLGGGSMDHSAGLVIVLGAIFLGRCRVQLTLLVACERLPRTRTARRKRTLDVRGLMWEAYVAC
jgi:hypothetical protein